MPKYQHLIEFPVGDWSDDGHGKCAYYQYWCNRTVHELREMHFLSGQVNGVEIGNIMNEYEEPLNEEVRDRLVELGLLDKDHDTHYGMDPDDVIEIWLNLLKMVDPGFEWEPLVKEPAERITFYGFDEKKRHLESPGYGCFYH